MATSGPITEPVRTIDDRRRQLLGRPVSLGAAWCVAIGVLLAQERCRIAVAAEPDAEVRDVILMLETGPLHLRFNVSLSGQSPRAARKASVERLMNALDANGDGKLSREETQRSPLFREKQRPGAEQFIRSIGADLTVSRRDVEQQIERFGGETVVYRQNASTSASDTEVFKLLDADSDRLVNADEMQNAVDRLLAKDIDDDECVTIDEFAALVSAPADPLIIMADQPRVPASTVAELMRDTHQTLLPAQMLLKYDKNRNQRLSPAELGWTPQRFAACDFDRDGQLNLKELSGLQKSPVDVELAVDVVRSAGQSMLRLLAATGPRLDDDRFPDLATIELPSAIVTFSTREVDPYEASMAIALRTFNELDQDNNGYLDRDETMLRERFSRGLFDQIDADGDGKIFGEEMKEFIRARGEPVSTTCQVTLFDDGAGFFSALDANGDRRISMREMRYADKTLSKMQRDDKPGLGELEPARRYRIEFVRGVFNPFGTADRPADAMMTQAIAAARPRPVGPIWFQRWDRNHDGDITWREFLGPRDAFDQLDADGDGLIDPREAESTVSTSTSQESKSQPKTSPIRADGTLGRN